MKITFIYPSIYECGFNAEKKPNLLRHIHRGLAYLSAMCKSEGFNDIDLIDLRDLGSWEELKEKIRSRRPDLLAVTMMSPDYDYAVKSLAVAKEVDKNIVTVVGGMHPTIMAEQLMKNEDVNHIIKGEGEYAFLRLVKSLSSGKKEEKVINGELADVNKIPFQDRELFDCLEMPYDFFLPLPFVSLLASRGCPYYCSFCAPGSKLMHGSKLRVRTVDNVMNELKELKKLYGFKSLMFWDDCFGFDREWTMEFCDKYKKNGFTEPFVCLMRADIIIKNAPMMKKLKETGLAMASIGFESGNNRILKFMNKGTTVEENLKAARICNRLGIKVWAFHMYGIPTETNKEAADTLRMIRKIKPYRSSAGFYTPIPGSFLYDYCMEKDLSLIGDHDGFVRFPEVDNPKIKNVDYEFMRMLAKASKKPSLGVKARLRVERVIFHKKNKTFKRKFAEEIEKNPGLNKMSLLRMAHDGKRI